MSEWHQGWGLLLFFFFRYIFFIWYFWFPLSDVALGICPYGLRGKSASFFAELGKKFLIHLCKIAKDSQWFLSCYLMYHLIYLLIYLQRIQALVTPSDDLPKTKREQERLLAIFVPEDDSTATTNGYFPVLESDSTLWSPIGAS